MAAARASYNYEVAPNNEGVDDHGRMDKGDMASPPYHHEYGAAPAEQVESDSTAHQDRHVPVQESKEPLATATKIPPYQIPNWPDGPRLLYNSTTSNVVNAALDILLILIALGFIALAIIAMRLDGTPVKSSIGPRFEEAIKLGPTIYPILFAAISGRALRGFARFRAERGSRISTLWPLLNNKTMFDAVISHWYLRQLNAVALFLLILWALSPLGSQATLRLVYRSYRVSTTTKDIRYLDTGILGNVYAYEAVISQNDVEKGAVGIPLTMPTIYEAALMQDVETKRGPVDNWGNIKIPRVDQLDPSLADRDGWIRLDNGTTVESYYSLLGLPIVNLPTEDAANFTVEAVYVALSPAHRSFGPPRVSNETRMHFSGLEISCPDCISRWQNERGTENSTIESTRLTTLLGPPFRQAGPEQLTNMTYSGARYIRFDSAASSGGVDDAQAGISTLMCTVTQHFVEADIRCTSGKCAAARVRISTTDHRSPNVTTFDWWGTAALDMISARSSSYSSTTSSSSELFINDSSANPSMSGFQRPWLTMVNLSRADPQVFADRATILLNTGLQIFMAPSGFTGDLPKSNMSIYGFPHIPADGLTQAMKEGINETTILSYTGSAVWSSLRAKAPLVAASTTADVTTFEGVYNASRRWVAILIISSAVLLITGVTGMCLGGLVLAPDIFDPLMSLTYDNPHLNLPSHASTIAGDERTRLLSSMTVRLGDVQPYGEVGKISFGQAANVKRLDKGKWYE